MNELKKADEVVRALREEYKETDKVYFFLRTLLKDAADLIDSLTAQLAAVTAERDAAVRCMKIIADTYRENVCDDGICGLCEYDADHGIEGYANECPGFESNECFSWRGAGKERKHG